MYEDELISEVQAEELLYAQKEVSRWENEVLHYSVALQADAGEYNHRKLREAKDRRDTAQRRLAALLGYEE